MTVRNGHGNGAGVPRVEVLPPDELPEGVAGAQRSAEAAVERDAQGRLADAQSAAELGRLGGMARAGQTRLSRRLALGETFADKRFEPYARAARAFRRAHVAQLARDVGGGTCGPAPSSIVASAALQLAASRFAFEVLADVALGSKLANDSRQNLLAAHELAAREAKARPRPASAFPWLQPSPPVRPAERRAAPDDDEGDDELARAAAPDVGGARPESSEVPS